VFSKHKSCIDIIQVGVNSWMRLQFVIFQWSITYLTVEWTYNPTVNVIVAFKTITVPCIGVGSTNLGRSSHFPSIFSVFIKNCKLRRYYFMHIHVYETQRPDSNRHPLTSLSQIPVQFKGLLQSAHRSEVQMSVT